MYAHNDYFCKIAGSLLALPVLHGLGTHSRHAPFYCLVYMNADAGPSVWSAVSRSAHARMRGGQVSRRHSDVTQCQ